MARGVNKVILIGNVGQDPEIRALGTGSRVANFSLATNRSWTNSAGQKQEKTEWHRIVIWGKLCDIVEQWVHKGDKLYVEGRLDYGSYVKEGVTVYTTDIVVYTLEMLGSASGGGGRESAMDANDRAQGSGPPVNPPDGSMTEPDDDLPF